MKIFIALFALVAVAAAAPPSNEGILQAILQAKFNAFKAKHGKVYSLQEEKIRLQNFVKNTEVVELHNERFAKGLETFSVEHNEMSDLSHEEYLNTRLGAVRPEHEDLSNVTVFKPAAGFSRPQSIDWRAHGLVNYVKNQGGCGSCYTFAAVGALEGHYRRKYGRMLDFSEQQLVDCSGGYGNKGCSGGWMHSCYQYIKDNGGINEQHNYRYESKVGSCRFRSDNRAARVDRHVMIRQHDEEDLANAVASVGPVAVAYDASTREFMLYKNGIYNSNNCDKWRTTHAVVVVGYGQEGNTPYWIIKNSWGSGWGENGYFRMIRNTGNKCGVASFSSYPVVS